jgi:hypothetical protein
MKSTVATNMCGVGIALGHATVTPYSEGFCVVKEVISGGAVDTSGVDTSGYEASNGIKRRLQIGDWLLRINEVSCQHMPRDEIKRHIIGPVGTNVVLVFATRGGDKPMILDLRRGLQPKGHDEGFSGDKRGRDDQEGFNGDKRGRSRDRTLDEYGLQIDDGDKEEDASVLQEVGARVYTPSMKKRKEEARGRSAQESVGSGLQKDDHEESLIQIPASKKEGVGRMKIVQVDESGTNQRLKWSYDIYHTSLPRLVELEDGSQELLLGEIKMTPPCEILKECEELIKENNGQIFLRLSEENEERFFSLSVWGSDGETMSYTPICHVHASGTLAGWGCDKGKRSDPPALEQAIFLSLHKLLSQKIVALPVSLETESNKLTSLRVSVMLKADAITRGALPENVIESLHANAGRKYARDLCNVLGWLLPSLVDMGENVFQSIYNSFSKHPH